ncbi:MAG: M48 family metalloprotease [Gammaproteobacteria bacterium]|nr:M48 family metalloprotease [Gammaproteobacteria bacterium]
MQHGIWVATRCPLTDEHQTPSVTILDHAAPMAFALSPKRLYLSRGLLAELSSEAELAFVLATQSSHLCAGHRLGHDGDAVLPRPEAIMRVLLTPGSFFERDWAQVLKGFDGASQLAAARNAMAITLRAGYSIAVLESLLDHLAAMRAAQVHPTLTGLIPLTTGPGDLDSSARATWLAQARRDAYARANPPSAGQLKRDAYMQQLDGLHFGSPVHEGVVRGRHFFHRELGISFELPAGWTLRNHSDRVVGWGPQRTQFFQLNAFRAKPGERFDDLLRRQTRLEPMPSAWFDLDGRAHQSMTARADTPLGRRAIDIVVTTLPTHIADITFALLMTQRQTPTNSPPALIQIARSLTRLSKKAQPFASPIRIHLTRPKAGTTFATLAKPGLVNPDTLRRINRTSAPHPIAGSLVKVLH